MADNHWLNRAYQRATQERDRARSAMEGVISRPVLRRPNTKTLLEAALRDPASVDPSGRGALAKFLTDTYGANAQHILPYLGLEEEEL